jgi:hypothetical protein
MVTIMDAARETGVNHMTLRNWIAAAGLKTTRVGHYLMVDPIEVKKLVAAKQLYQTLDNTRQERDYPSYEDILGQVGEKPGIPASF